MSFEFFNLYKYENEYIGQIKTNIQENEDYSSLLTIFILDRSGSMFGSFEKLINKVIPKCLDILNYTDNDNVKH